VKCFTDTADWKDNLIEPILLMFWVFAFVFEKSYIEQNSFVQCCILFTGSYYAANVCTQFKHLNSLARRLGLLMDNSDALALRMQNIPWYHASGE
jgi:hypothetical protein